MRLHPVGPRLLALLLAVTGCDDEAPAAGGPAASTTSAAPTEPESFAAIDDQPIPLGSVLAFSRGGKALHVAASTHRLSCRDVGGRGFIRESGEMNVDFTIAPLIRPGKEPEWSLTRIRFGSITRQGALGSVEPSAVDPSETVRVQLAGEAEVPAGGSLRTLHLDGEMVAEGCGVLPITGASPRAQDDLDLRIDERPVAIRGATFEPSERVLHLSTEPHDCGGGYGESDLALSLKLREDAVTHVKMEGMRLGHTVGANPEALEARPRDTSEGAAFALDGAAEIGGYGVALSGSVVARSCEPSQR